MKDMSNLTSALENAWLAISAYHPQCPPVVIRIGSGRQGKGAQLDRHGHFSTINQWHSMDVGVDADTFRPEVMISGETLDRGAASVFATLLHEAVHAINWARGVNDTSRQGRYHNKNFKTVCELVKLNCEKHATFGWTITTLSDIATERYAESIARIDRALRLRLDSSAMARIAEQNKKPSTSTSHRCGCGRLVRAANSTWAKGDIVCGRCLTTFGERPSPFAGADQGAVNKANEERDNAIANAITTQATYNELTASLMTSGEYKAPSFGERTAAADETAGRGIQLAAEMAIDAQIAAPTDAQIAELARALVAADSVNSRLTALHALASLVNRDDLKPTKTVAPDGRFAGLDLD